MGKPSTSRLRIALAGLAAVFSVSSGVAAPPEVPTKSPDAPVPPAPPAKAERTRRVKASIICDERAATPGSAVTIGVSFQIQPKWHMYWNGRNEGGLPPTVDFQLPAGYSVDALQWPTPVRKIEPGDILNHVYYDTLTLVTTLHVPASAKPDTTAAIKAKLTWMVCDDACVAEQADATLKLPIVAIKEPLQSSADAKAIEAARARIPRELSKDSRDVQIQWTPESVTLACLAASHMSFYPSEDCFPLADVIKDADGDRSYLNLRMGDPDKEHTSLAGILEVRRGKDATDFYFIHAAPKPAPGLSGKPATPKSPMIPTDPSKKPIPNPVDPKPIP